MPRLGSDDIGGPGLTQDYKRSTSDQTATQLLEL